MLSGAAVRLTGSGLGCSDWPRCEEGRLVAPLELNPMIEFVNRLVSFVVVATVVLVIWAALRRMPYRRDLLMPGVWIAGFTGLQVVVGGITVLQDLWPPIVMAHFLFSMVLLWLAVLLVHRAEHDEPAAPTTGATPPLRALFAAGAVVLVTGTVVTGSGPHGGDETVERLGFYVPTVARIHAVSAIVLLALLVVVLTARTARTRPELMGAGRLTLVAVLVQGGVGYYQYFNGVPALAVFLHVMGSMAVWLTTSWLVLEHGRVANPTRRAAVEVGA